MWIWRGNQYCFFSISLPWQEKQPKEALSPASTERNSYQYFKLIMIMIINIKTKHWNKSNLGKHIPIYIYIYSIKHCNKSVSVISYSPRNYWLIMYKYLKAVFKAYGRTLVFIIAQRVLRSFWKLTFMTDHLYGLPQRTGETYSCKTHIVYIVQYCHKKLQCT